MFCEKCGTKISDDQNFCYKCGAPTNAGSQIRQRTGETYDRFRREAKKAGESFSQTIEDTRRDFYGNRSYGTPLKTNRSLLSYILLTFITCGIYCYYYHYSLAKEINIACDGDGENTGGLIAFILLSYITLGFYAYYWEYKLGNRLISNAGRYHLNLQGNGTTILMWDIFGILLCGIGPFIGMNILMKNSNAICAAYNRTHGFAALN